MDTFGDRLKNARESAGLTQGQLADSFGRTKGSISQWENGQAEPGIDLLAKICVALKVSANFLLLGRPEPLLSQEAQEFASRFDQCPPSAKSALLQVFGTPVPNETVEKHYPLPPKDPPKASPGRPPKARSPK